MAAYVIAQVDEITDPGALEEYRAKVGPIVERYGGRTVAAGPPDVVEGQLRPTLAAVMQFPSMEQLQAFYAAPDYQDLKALRLRATRGHVLFLDGLPTPEPSVPNRP